MTNVITDFLSEGLASARPASPNIPAGSIGIYYATDTGAKSLWDPSTNAWIAFVNSGVTPTIVQNAVNVGSAIDTVTMGSAPTNGNMLIAIVLGNGIDVPASGWNAYGANVSAGPSLDTHFCIYWKIAGAGESTTQQPINSTQNCGIAVYEIGGTGMPSVWGNNENQSGTATTVAVKMQSARGLVIGLVLNANATTQPSSFTGAVADNQATGGSRAVSGFHIASPVSGTNTAQANYGSSQTGIYMAAVALI